MAKRIAKDLESIKEDLAAVKRHLADGAPLTREERRLLEKSFDNERKGRLVPSSRLREELGGCDSR